MCTPWQMKGLAFVAASSVLLLVGWSLDKISGTSYRPVDKEVTFWHEDDISRNPIKMIEDLELSFRKLVESNYLKSNNLGKISDSFQALMGSLRASAVDVKSDEGESKHQHLTCSEEYHGAKSDYPDYLTNWKFSNCVRKDLAAVVTVCLTAFDATTHAKVVNVINSIRKKYVGIKFVVATDDKRVGKDLSTFETVEVKILEKENNLANAWNSIISDVKTPFVFVGRVFDGFGHYTDITRAVHVLNETPGTEIVSFGDLNQEDIWNIDCHQILLKNYELRIIDGYRRSFNECTVCDSANGPFLAKSATLQRIKFDSSLENEDMIFLDFFLQLRRKRKLVVSCPDMMAHVLRKSPEIVVSKKDWIPLVQKWQINEVVVSGHDKLEFDCIESKLSCPLFAYANKGLYMPLCCVKATTKMLKDFIAFCDRHRMYCEIDTGSVLAAVKLNRPMPWDVDLDAGFHKDNISTFVKYKSELEQLGYTISMDKTVHALGIGYQGPELNGIHMDMWTYRPNISIGNMHTGTYKPTRILFDGILVNVPYNPGLFARNRYGKEIFKHSPSWATLNRENSYAEGLLFEDRTETWKKARIAPKEQLRVRVVNYARPLNFMSCDDILQAAQNQVQWRGMRRDAVRPALFVLMMSLSTIWQAIACVKSIKRRPQDESTDRLASDRFASEGS